MHEQFLLLALENAQLGRGVCAPNPSVGAVAVHNGKIIAQSWHRGAGTPHAEQLLLKQLPKNIPEITLYVTLEPCNHWGKTPPCVDVIVDYGIQQVVYAYSDPNPVIVANNTSRLLREKGISVLHYPLPAIDAFYQSYAHWTSTQTPWVTIKMAQSLDGKIAGVDGARTEISNAMCADFTHQQRLQSDVILTTARTINQDNPSLNARVTGGDVAKPIAVIDPRLEMHRDATVFNTSKHLHVYHDVRYKNPNPQENCSYYPMPTVNGGLDLGAVIRHLGGLGYHDVWVEVGATLFNALHEAGLVNKTYLYVAPTVLGPKALSAYPHAHLFETASHLSWQIMGDNVIASFDWSKNQEGALCSQD